MTEAGRSFDEGSLKGRLVVATPVLGDPNFARTVALVLEHGDHGALGLVLNRPSEVALGAPLSRWRELASPPGVLFVGGPVSREAVIGLARLAGRGPGSGIPGIPGIPGGARGVQPVVGDLNVVDLTADPDQLAPSVAALRIFTGYAGWGGGQLEAEIGQRAWFVVDAAPTDAFSSTPDGLWRDVLRRQAPALRRFSLYPADPSLN